MLITTIRNIFRVRVRVRVIPFTTTDKPLNLIVSQFLGVPLLSDDVHDGQTVHYY